MTGPTGAGPTGTEGAPAAGRGERRPIFGRELGLVVSTPPERGDLDRALALARAARRLGAEVGLFVMDAAVVGLPCRGGELRALADDGATIIACASSVQARGLSELDVDADLGSQDDHAALAHRAERLLAWT